MPDRAMSETRGQPAPLRQLNQMQQYLVHEFVEDYQDGIMSRRDLVRRVLHITGGVAATATVLTALGVPATAFAQGSQPAPPTEPQSPLSVAEDDERVTVEMISFLAEDGTDLMAYQVSPTDAGNEPLPLVLICHENRGLTDHIKDVARRFAIEGYVASAVDLLSREGGTDAVEDPSEIPSILSGADPERHIGDFQVALAYYLEQPNVDPDRIAMNGYCFGGGITWRTVQVTPEIRAAAPFYGPPPPLERVPDIQAAVLGVYAEDPDDFANNGRDELEAALEEADVTFDIRVYPDTEHAFHNDTGARWNEERAVQAWSDTLAWFDQHLNA